MDSGDLGSSIARLACDAGYAVVLSNSRHPDTLADLASDLGENATAATPAGAARTSDVVVLSVPLFAINDLPVGDLAGKVVIDTTNYYPERDGQIEALDNMSPDGSGTDGRRRVGPGGQDCDGALLRARPL
ncbi:NADPH-dependent F420 reductase [Jiangella anatolica]|uniref:NADPH-dependent F420 reductase n=1 Tax=Jiangella anatolica TaxID=2670374 RepID=UPI0018F39AF4|nr:NAD(P)-binding domain-containing protein [Jiangella anatolica]